jgi:hypothetical protein
MSSQTLQGHPAPANFPAVDCRVWERYQCGLETTCQPIAARGDNEMTWPAQIRDLSLGGVGVVMRRRFERGVGLAIEIPESESSSATTLMGKVVHTTSLPGGLWLHGCAFVSLLSDDELARLLRLGHGSASENTSHVIPEVVLEGLEGTYPRRLIRQFHLKGVWPPVAGTVLKVRLGKSPQDHAHVRVERCVQEAGRWVLFYTFCDSSNQNIRQALGHRQD